MLVVHLCSAANRRFQLHQIIRGGALSDISSSNDSSAEGSVVDSDEQSSPVTTNTEHDSSEHVSLEKLPPAKTPIAGIRRPLRIRHASDLIQNLMERSLCSASVELRQLISQRTNDYISQLYEENDNLQSPRKLLHYLAPKIPAIKHSPDVALRIQTTPSDMDPGLAACLIGELGHVCELYEKERMRRKEISASIDDNQVEEPIAIRLARDRRFEQLLECVLCGVNVKLRTEEHTKQNLDHETSVDSIEEILDKEDVQESRGLSIKDAARAAWGISMLGLHELDSIGGEKIEDLLIALSLRIRELLLARLQALRQDDLDWIEGSSEQDSIMELSEELAEETASAVWAFACVRACTGIRFSPLFEVCCSIMCQDPFELRRRAQEAEAAISRGDIGKNDAIERLALSERTSTSSPSMSVKHADTVSDDRLSILYENKQALADWLTPNEVTDVLWAIALHGSSDSVSHDEIALSEATTAFREIAFDRLVAWLKDDLYVVKEANQESLFEHNVHDSGERSDPTQRESGSLNVEVVDAASLLELEKAALEATAQTDAAATTVLSENIESLVVPRKTLPTQRKTMKVNGYASIFSPHDLCSIVWASMELHDPLRDTIVRIVLDTFNAVGHDALYQLSIGDLSNLAWGLAKMATDFGAAGDELMVSLSLAVAEASLVHEVKQFGLDYAALAKSLNRKCQPPELSRLVWAVLTTYTQSNNPSDARPEAIRRLARTALLIAANNLDSYGAEDVTRIVWGYLEVSDKGICDLDMHALGRSLATIEVALHNWETGSASSKQEVTDKRSSMKQPLRFASFFGKTNTLMLLDQRLEQESSDETDELHIPTKKPRPLLKDLPVDPSMLCKFSCSMTKMNANNILVNGGESLTRIALRLLSSKNGRLLRECPLLDLARLCGALAETKLSIGRERVSLFVRRVVQFLNEELVNDRAIGPAESAKLLWAVGELGVKFNLKNTDVETAHRKLELIAEVPILLTNQLNELTDRRIAKLLRGTVTTNLLMSNKAYTKMVILEARFRLSQGCSTAVICDLTETVAMLKEALTDAPIAEESIPNDKNILATDAKIDDISASDLLEAMGSLMKELTKQTIRCMDTFSAIELRRVLSVYALSPIHADEVVAGLAKVVEDRRIALEELESSDLDRENLFQRGVVQAQKMRKSLNGSVESPFATFRNSLKSLFSPGGREESNNDPLDLAGMDATIVESIDEVLRTINDADHYSTVVAASSGLSIHKAVEEIFQLALFELGRCAELIAHYHRIDFQSGHRTSRLDKDLRRDMTKRLLSRALP